MNSVSPLLPFSGDSTLAVQTRGNPRELAQEFESVMLAQLIKQMRVSGDEQSSLFPGDNSDTLGSLFDLHMSRHLASQGGFGIAESLTDSFKDLTESTPGDAI